MEHDRLPSGVLIDVFPSRTVDAHFSAPANRSPMTHRLPFRPLQFEEFRPYQSLFVQKEIHIKRNELKTARVNDKDEEADRYYLPLLEVSMDVKVVGTTSRTVLTQSFTNLSSLTIPAATYCFPLYDGSIVVGFRCWIGEDRLLEAW